MKEGKYVKKTQEVFQRYEKKISAYTKASTKNSGKRPGDPGIVPDVFGRHTICNVYFDTESYELIRASYRETAV